MRTPNDLKRQMVAEGRKYAYVSASVCDLNAANIPNAGPSPSIKGMRFKYWGKNAIIVKQGQYAYKL